METALVIGFIGCLCVAAVIIVYFMWKNKDEIIPVNNDAETELAKSEAELAQTKARLAAETATRIRAESDLQTADANRAIVEADLAAANAETDEAYQDAQLLKIEAERLLEKANIANNTADQAEQDATEAQRIADALMEEANALKIENDQLREEAEAKKIADDAAAEQDAIDAQAAADAADAARILAETTATQSNYNPSSHTTQYASICESTDRFCYMNYNDFNDYQLKHHLYRPVDTPMTIQSARSIETCAGICNDTSNCGSFAFGTESGTTNKKCRLYNNVTSTTGTRYDTTNPGYEYYTKSSRSTTPMASSPSIFTAPSTIGPNPDGTGTKYNLLHMNISQDECAARCQSETDFDCRGYTFEKLASTSSNSSLCYLYDTSHSTVSDYGASSNMVYAHRLADVASSPDTMPSEPDPTPVPTTGIVTQSSPEPEMVFGVEPTPVSQEPVAIETSLSTTKEYVMKYGTYNLYLSSSTVAASATATPTRIMFEPTGEVNTYYMYANTGSGKRYLYGTAAYPYAVKASSYARGELYSKWIVSKVSTNTYTIRNVQYRTHMYASGSGVVLTGAPKSWTIQ